MAAFRGFLSLLISIDAKTVRDVVQLKPIRNGFSCAKEEIWDQTHGDDARRPWKVNMRQTSIAEQPHGNIDFWREVLFVKCFF